MRRAVPFRSKPKKPEQPETSPGTAWCKAHKHVTPIQIRRFFYCPIEGCTRKTTKPKRA